MLACEYYPVWIQKCVTCNIYDTTYLCQKIQWCKASPADTANTAAAGLSLVALTSSWQQFLHSFTSALIFSLLSHFSLPLFVQKTIPVELLPAPSRHLLETLLVAGCKTREHAVFSRRAWYMAQERDCDRALCTLADRSDIPHCDSPSYLLNGRWKETE